MSVERRVILDFSGAESVGQIHDLLKGAFGFPDYYGRNWDALYDCLGDLLTDGEALSVEICGFYSMDAALRAKCAPMLIVLGDVQEEREHLSVSVLS